MCIAILQPSNTPALEKSLMSRCHIANHDGMGMLWTEKGQLHHFKELNSFRRFYKVYRNIHRKHSHETNIVLHFRWATHGKKDLANCHPFFVNVNLGFVHNGVFSSLPMDPDRSDTALFAERLRLMPDGFLDSDLVDVVEMARGSSKLIFLDHTNRAIIFGEEQGDWDKSTGCWFSNTGYKYEPVSKWVYNGKAIQTSMWDDWDEGAEYPARTTTPAQKNWRKYSEKYRQKETKAIQLATHAYYCAYCGGYMTEETEIKKGLCTRCMGLLEGEGIRSMVAKT